jgi:hypothetical protein
MQTWQLFLDESGSVTEPGEQFVLAGWLARAYASKQMLARLAEAVSRVLPGYGDVPHQGHLNQAGYFALLAWKRREVGDCLAAGEQVLADATRAWPGLAATHWETPWHPDYRDASDLTWWLRTKAPQAYGEALRAKALADHRVVEALEAIPRLVEGPVFAIASVMPAKAPGPFDPASRYGRALQLIAERARLCVADGAHIWIHASSISILGLDIKKVQTWLDGTAGPADRRLLAGPVARNDTRPGLVLADMVANRLARRCIKGNPDWPGVVLNTRAQLALPVETPLPSVAHEGIPSEAIRSRKVVPELAAFVPRWAGDQARLWIEALARPA